MAPAFPQLLDIFSLPILSHPEVCLSHPLSPLRCVDGSHPSPCTCVIHAIRGPVLHQVTPVAVLESPQLPVPVLPSSLFLQLPQHLSFSKDFATCSPISLTSAKTLRPAPPSPPLYCSLCVFLHNDNLVSVAPYTMGTGQIWPSFCFCQ